MEEERLETESISETKEIKALKTWTKNILRRVPIQKPMKIQIQKRLDKERLEVDATAVINGIINAQSSTNRLAMSDIHIDDEDDEAKLFGQEFYFLPVQFNPSRFVHPIEGIILHRISASEETYIRIGKFSVWRAEDYCSQLPKRSNSGMLDSAPLGKRRELTIL